MNKALRRQIEKLIEEEQQKPVDEALLNELRRLAAADTTYGQLPAEKRNALNAFFREVKSLMTHELLTGDFGADIIIDSIIVLCFEVGARVGPKLSLIKPIMGTPTS